MGYTAILRVEMESSAILRLEMESTAILRLEMESTAVLSQKWGSTAKKKAGRGSRTTAMADSEYSQFLIFFFLKVVLLSWGKLWVKQNCSFMRGEGEGVEQTLSKLLLFLFLV